MMDTALQRKNMVESQVRPSDVTDRRITAAMMTVPRERFVPKNLADLAYMDGEIAVGGGRALMAPRDFARLLQLAAIEEADNVLIVGAGAGYSAAVAAGLARHVTALDCDPSASAASKNALSELGVVNVAVVTGPLAAGWPEDAPYDAIVVEGAIEAVPSTLTAQLAPSGRLVTILLDGGIGRAASLIGGVRDQAPRVAFEASAPALPGFSTPVKAFQF